MDRIFRVRPDWNTLGTRRFPVPLWFRRRLRRLDPRLVLQYIPPWSEDREGVQDSIYPWGIWSLCRLIPRSRHVLHPVCVWDLADAHGLPVPPGESAWKLLRRAYGWRRQGVDLLERKMEEHLLRENVRVSEKKREELREDIRRKCSQSWGRQWSNRVMVCKP
jgi:hypothetical protein